MKNYVKILLSILVVAVVGVTTYFIGYHVGKGKEDKDNSVYMTSQEVKKVVASAYSLVDESFEASSDNDSTGVNWLKVAQKKDGLVFEQPATNNDVLVKVSGSVVPVSGDVTLDVKTALKGSLKYVQSLVSNNVTSCADSAATYRVRNAETAPTDFDLKVMVTGYLSSIKINMMITDIDGDVLDNTIIILTYNDSNEVYELIHATKDVYAIYNAEADETYYLDSSKTGADEYKNQIKTELDNFEKANSNLDIQTDMSKILLG